MAPVASDLLRVYQGTYIHFVNMQSPLMISSLVLTLVGAVVVGAAGSVEKRGVLGLGFGGASVPPAYPPLPLGPLDDPYLLGYPTGAAKLLVAKPQAHIAVPVGPTSGELAAALAAAREASHVASAAQQRAAQARDAVAAQQHVAAAKEAAATVALQRAEAAAAAADALQRSHAAAITAVAVQKQAAASAAAAAAALKVAAAAAGPKKDWAPWG